MGSEILWEEIHEQRNREEIVHRGQPYKWRKEVETDDSIDDEEVTGNGEVKGESENKQTKEEKQ